MENLVLKFQPYFCEENVWHLCQEPLFGDDDVWIIFISNQKRTVATWCQRDAQGDAPVVWDYHVVVAHDNHGALDIWDLNSTLGVPCDWQTYFTVSFRLQDSDNEFSPTFRVIKRDVFLETFKSDRSHMNPDEVAFPLWPKISETSNLQTFVDMRSDQVGDVVGLTEIRNGWTPAAEAP